MRNYHLKLAVVFVASVGLSVLIASPWVSSIRGEEAEEVYENSCVPCHQPSGIRDSLKHKNRNSGLLASGLQDLLKRRTDAEIIKAIREGRKGRDKSPEMPAFLDELTDEEIAGLLKYLRRLSTR